MHLALAVIGLAAVAVAQEFIPIGGGSGASRPVGGGVSPSFGEPFTPTIIDPNDPSFQPANFAGNRPNPIALFPKSQNAGTPHEAPVDFTFIHQHSYKEPFRNDQFVGILHNPIGAARPNIPRTLGRENIYIDPHTNPNSDISKAERAEREKKAKNMVFYGLAPPLEKDHRPDEFAPSSVPFQKPWDQWYDRFTEPPAVPRSSHYLLTQTKRPNMVDIPFYAADRGKRQAEVTTETPEINDQTSFSIPFRPLSTTTPPATSLLSDAIGTTTSVAGTLETTTAHDIVIIGTTTTTTAEPSTTTTTTHAPDAATTTASTESTTTVAAPNTTTSTAVVSSTTPSVAAKPVNLTAPAVTSAPSNASTHHADVVTAPTATRLTNGTRKSSGTTATPHSTGTTLPFRLQHGRRVQSTPQPSTPVQKLRRNKTKLPPRTTLAVEMTTATQASRRPHALLKSGNTHITNTTHVSANNTARATTKLPIRTSIVQRRPNVRTRVPLRRVHNVTATFTPTAAVNTSVATTATTIPAATTPATAVVGPLKTQNRTTATNTTMRTKAPFRIFSKHPLTASKLPARTPILEEPKPSAIESNSVGTLRTEVNRLLTTVVQLQSTVIAQQQRIALLENQLRLRRGAVRRPARAKTTQFVAPDGRTVERTTVDIRKGRSIKLRHLVSKDSKLSLRQRSNIA